jgi:hypothetical protein
MGQRRHRSCLEPSEEHRWEQLALLCKWPEQSAYEEIHPLTLFGAFGSEWARKIGFDECTLYRSVSPITRLGGGFPVYQLWELLRNSVLRCSPNQNSAKFAKNSFGIHHRLLPWQRCRTLGGAEESRPF